MAEHPYPDPVILTDEEARKIFIDDGGQAEYHDPIHGARDQARYAGRQFDLWLQHHDEELTAKLHGAEKEAREREYRRTRALGLAVEWAASWKSSAPSPDTIVRTAKKFESYLKGETNA